MSVDQLPPGKARPAQGTAQFVRYEEFIDQQIESTRRTVKLVDVLTALLTIVVGTLSFLLVAAVAEHWLLPGGFNVALRLVLFAVLFTCLTFYTTRKLWPLVRGSINPAYAAQAIEQDNPSLKNSLLNLLLFRQHRDDVTDAVYETLEEQAAKRLHRVPIESAVDRTHLLRLGYALIAILAVVALYKILSPKDPFASAERILMPWARIAAPSRVSIENIAPGHVTLARGETLVVSADVRGIDADDPVIVKFTTADGQAVDRLAAMKPDAAGFRFQGTIPPAGDTSLGVAQDLRYHLEAGDARSLEYKVTVVSAPMITVERIDYDYPEYTGFADRSIERLGDIRAIEGTRVTIHARSNQSIDEAAIDFQADGRRDLALTAHGEQAQVTFTLELRDDRSTAKFTSYVLRFTGSDGRPNRDPVKYPIDVVPDYRPEAAILAPKEKTREVRLDETVAIEIEARDPDFSLSGVQLTGESAGRKIFDEQLLAKSRTGRFAGRLIFTPSAHELHAGDVVRYWATVRDNRAPQANEATTDSQTFRIVGPDPRQPGQPPQDRIARRDQRQQPGEQQNEQQNQQEQPGQSQDQQPGQDQSNAGEQGQSGGESTDSAQGGEQGAGQQSGESSSADSNSGESGEQGAADQSSENGQGENSQNRQGDEQSSGQSDGSSNGGDESSASEQSGESGQAQQRPVGKQESGKGTQTGESQPGSQDGAQSSPANEDRDGNQSNSNEQISQQRGGGSRDASPVSSEGDNDGEAFERIQDFLKEQGQLPKESQQQQGQHEQSNAEQGAQQQEREEKQHGETSNGQSPDAESQSGPSDSAAKQQGEQSTSGEDSPGANQSSSESAESPSGKPQAGESQRGSENSQSPSEQPGAETSAGESGEKTKEPSGQSDQQQPGGGQKTQGEGESGAGNQAEQGQAPPESPESPDANSSDSQEKWQQDPSDDNQGEQQKQPDAGRGQRQSDSHGEQGGEQTGAAEKNNSQKSERDGTGGSGQNQSADEGMGESSEQGAGRNSSSGGQDGKANEKTGQSSENMRGEGSQRREGQGSQSGGEQGNQQRQQSGEQQGESQGGEQGEQRDAREQGQQQQGEQGQNGQQGEQQQPSQSGGEQGEKSSQNGGRPSLRDGARAPARDARDGQNKPSNEQQGGQRSGTSATDGAGRVPEGVMQPSGATGEAPGADAANLEFARKQTDLVLETLADQMKRQQVDKRLLDKLGWTEADMKRFVERWQQLKAAADANNPDANEAQRELDDALRSLGLRRGELRQSTVTDDENRNLRQGYRGAVPLEYQERLRAYNQGVSRARQDDD